MKKIILLGSGDTLGNPVVGCKCDVCTSKDPKDKRTRFGLYISYKNCNILIDTNPDIKQQFLNNDLDFKDIDYILLTHTHSDHINGMGELSYRKPIKLFHGNNVLTSKNIDYFRYLENENVVKFTKFEENKKIKIADDVYYKAIKLNHGFPTRGFIIYLGNKKIGIMSDTNTNIKVDELINYKDCDFLFIDGFSETFQQVENLYSFIGEKPLDNKNDWYHLTFDDIIGLKKVLTPKEIIILHISHIAGLHKYLEEKYNNLIIGYDGLTINF